MITLQYKNIPDISKAGRVSDGKVSFDKFSEVNDF